VKVERKWPEEWPNAGRSGVYLIFGEDRDLLYVGKASMSNSLGARLSSYFGYDENKVHCKVCHKSWHKKPCYIVSVAVPENMLFEAPALEEFLISKLPIPENTRGRKS